jgi:hypothetical protein
MVETLLDLAKGYEDVCNENGPYDITEEPGDLVLRLLFDYGYGDQQSQQEYTELMFIAVSNGWNNVIEYLLERTW